MKNIIPGAEKLLCIMEELAEGPRSQQELAKTCLVSDSTCYRALQTLLAHGWIYRNTSGLYELSAAFSLLAQHSSKTRFRSLQPWLEALSRQCGMASKLSIREGYSQLTLLRTESPQPIGVSPRQGARFPLAEGTVGAALLCETPLEEIRRICLQCPGELEEHDAAVVEERVAVLRCQGWLFSGKLTRWNIFAMSASLRHGGAVVAAVTLIGLVGDFRNPAGIAGKLLKAIEQMEALLA